MCGLFGTNAKNSLSQRFLEKAEKTNQYRGPDATNYYKAKHHETELTFGHTRLIITGSPEQGKQPVANGEDLILVYNGAIFSFENVHVGGMSDTTYLSQLLEDGIADEKLNSLNGFFAFCAYYPKEDAFYLVRDRFGEKPLYYRCIGEDIYFSSTARPFRALETGRVNTIQEARGGGILFDEINPIEGVKQVPPGSYLRFQKGKTIIKKWYKPAFPALQYKKNNYAKVIDKFNELLIDAVKIRIKDQDTVAVSLSGGLDSTLVVDTVLRVGGVNVEAFTLSVNDDRFNELSIVKQHAEKLKIHLNVISEPPHDIDQFKACMEVLEFPSFNFSFVGYDSYYKAVSSTGIRVILEGHGPDEYLGGYASMLSAYIAGQILKGNITAARKSLYAYTHIFNVTAQRALLSIVRNILQNLRQFSLPSGQKINHRFFDSLSMPIVLRTFDRISMLNHIETRSPFMDYRLVELGRSLSDDFLFQDGKTKSILRTILEQRGFKESDFGPKIGFTANYNSVLEQLSQENNPNPSKDIRLSAQKRSFHIARAISQNIFDNQKYDN